jgi:hypothetical protein
MAVEPGPSLAELGLRSGDRVRFRRGDGGHWREGRVTGRERDGSVALRDEKGSSRSLHADRLEVRRAGPRGGPVWVAVTTVAAGTEQLDLFAG